MRTLVLSCAAALAAALVPAALADYVDPPDWSQSTDFTHQTWEFNADGFPLPADGGYTNTFGSPALIDVYRANPDYMFWVWDMMFGGTRHGMWGGMTFGLPAQQVALAETFYVPNHARPTPWHKQIWVQVAYWGSTSLGGCVLTVDVARDAAFQNILVSYPAAAADIVSRVEDGGGSTGQYWRFTHTFELPEQPAGEYVRVSVAAGGSMAVFIDQVSIDTRCVQPRPGDANGDGDIGAADLDAMLDCWSGPGIAVGGSCNVSNLDGDTDVDLADYAELQTACGTAW